MRAPSLPTFLLLPILPLLVIASPQGPDSSSSVTATLISTSTRTITYTIVKGTETLTSTYVSANPVALTTTEPSTPSASRLPDIKTPSGVGDTGSSLVVAPYPSSSPTRGASASSSVASTAALPTGTGAPTKLFEGAAPGRLGLGMAGLGAVVAGAMGLVGLM